MSWNIFQQYCCHGEGANLTDEKVVGRVGGGGGGKRIRRDG